MHIFANSRISLLNPHKHVRKELQTGPNWYALFFGFLIFLIHGMYVHFALFFCALAAVALIVNIPGMEKHTDIVRVYAFLVNIVLFFTINKMILASYLKRGYHPA